MSKLYYIDTETCGLHGPAILIQYAIDDGPIILHNVWRTPIHETLSLIEDMCQNTVIGFNLAFDWFHLVQIYTTLMQFEDVMDWPTIPQYAIYEKKAIDMNICLKPKHCFDIFLHARKGPYQSTMDRSDIKIKKVPTPLARVLSDELTKRIPLKDVYFARNKTDEGRKKRWAVRDILDANKEVIPEFKDIVLSFAPSSALKALAGDIFGLEDVTKFEDVDLPDWTKPKEAGWAPYAIGPYIEKGKIIQVDTPTLNENKECPYHDWKGKWPIVIKHHITHWEYNERARTYAKNDVKYTRDLYKHFGSPDPDDTDSVLSCLVACVRWYGYAIDKQRLTRLYNHAKEKITKPPRNFRSTAECYKYITEVMDETERIIMLVDGRPSTSKQLLIAVAKMTIDEVCNDCNGFGCSKCGNEGVITTGKLHPAAIRANEILNFRKAEKEVQLYIKLLAAGRFHASFKVIGTLSGRMAGADNLNPQGINKSLEVRDCFPLANFDKGYVLCGGDFDQFEVCIAEAAYNDPVLREELLVGKKMHALFGLQLFPNMTYEEITHEDNKALYGTAKACVFAMLYGGDSGTLNRKSNIPLEVAEEAYQRWLGKYKVWAKERQKYFDMFCGMRQPNGIGTKVEWHEPHEHVESLLGFKRYFTLENRICEALFKLSENPPQKWQDLKIKVVRRDRTQTACGAVRSALLCAAFSIQSGNMRAASNHVIQSTGAQMTKILQSKIWELQPYGISRWYVQPMNIHDEILCACLPEAVPRIREIVNTFIESHKDLVPLLGIDWKDNMLTWASKDRK